MAFHALTAAIRGIAERGEDQWHVIVLIAVTDPKPNGDLVEEPWSICRRAEFVQVIACVKQQLVLADQKRL